MFIQGMKNKVLREGITFKKMLKFLEESQHYSKEELKNYQDEHLNKIMKHCYENVPYYKEIFNKNKLMPSDIRTQKDLWKLPILTKNDIKQNFNKLKATNMPKWLLNEGHTSGTTGTPAHFYRDLNSINFENATVWRQWKWAGIDIGDRIVVCRGNEIKVNEKEHIFWKKNNIQKQLFLSSFYLSDENMKYYIEEFKRYDGKALQAYPSTAYVIAKYLEKINDKIKLKAVFTSSEPIYDFQRKLIEDRFECKIWDFYGLAERVVSASECKTHEGLHINEEYGITEILDEKEKEANKGFLVGSTLHNYAMPLIRYVTNDYTKISCEKCSCGIEHRMISPIETKKEDMVITKEGRYISPSIITHAFKPLTHVAKSQVIQHDFDDFEIKIIPEEGFNNTEIDLLMKGLKERFGQESSIDINIVEDIPRTKNGKFRWVISKISKGKS
ncbi:TPA: phenylacetate--CoA ligase family protein [Clostridium botulinum]|nr:phenylacetate--CoA ligase family protein [Clostridium botulinum]